MKELRLLAFDLKKITMLSATAPTFFSYKTFLIPPVHTSRGRKKRLKLRWGMSHKKKVSRMKDRPKECFFKKKV